MQRTTYVVSACLFLAIGCTPPPPPVTPGSPVTLTEEQKSVVRAAVAKTLKDPESARFGDMAATDSPTTFVVCGYVNGKNSYGGYVGMQPFAGIMPNDWSFSVVRIGGSPADRWAVGKYCREHGVRDIS